MQMQEAASRPVQACEPTPAPARPPACPICAGVLVPLRGFSRCARCRFTVCAGCEPAADDFACRRE
jgi:hypothetical protein